MNTYKIARFPPDMIRLAVWLCYRSDLSHSDIENPPLVHQIWRQLQGIEFFAANSWIAHISKT